MNRTHILSARVNQSGSFSAKCNLCLEYTKLPLCTIALALALGTCGAVQAVTYTWVPGVTGQWNVGANWGGTAPTPTNTDDVIIDGETSTASVASLNSNGTVNNLNSLTISSGDKLELTIAAERRMLLNGASGVLNNAGTLSNAGASGRIVLDTLPAAANTNSGLIEVSAGEIWLGFSMGAYSINNAGGTIRTKTGGTLIARQTITINGGALDVQAGSFVDHASWSDGFNWNNVTATNAGTYRALLTSAIGGSRFGNLTGTTTFANSGTIDLQNVSTVGTNNIEAYFTVGSSASLTTTGSSVINILQNSTTGGTGHNAYLRLDASGSSFVNNGAISVTSVAGSLGTAQLRSSRPVSNAGTITVNGPTSSIAMAGQTFTQTAGLLDVKNGGGITAATLNITGGTLKGNGTITATNTNVSATHTPGNSPGIQPFVGNLTYNNGANVQWELIGNTIVGRGTNYDGVDVSSNLNFAGTTSLNLVFNAGSSVLWSNTFWETSHEGTNGWLLFDVAGTTSNLSNITLNTINWLDSASNSFSSALPRSSFSLFQSGNDVYLSYTVVQIPEPSSLLLLGAGVLLIARRRKA